MIIELNKRDSTGLFAEARAAAQDVQRYYAQRGAADRVDLAIFDGAKTSNGHYMEISQVREALDRVFFPEAR